MLPTRPQELPPTAGLPLTLADLRPGRATLAADIAVQIDVPALQLECSGTACLLVTLVALRELQPQRRRVVVPAFTCPLVAIAVHQAGLELQLCDVRASHFDLDPTALRAVCDEQTLAIIPTHLGGRIADVDDAVAVARRVGAYVIEDAAQTLGGRINGTSIGLIGDVGFFSLAAGKGLSIYEGGLLLARDPSLREHLKQTSKRVVPRRLGWELRRTVELLGYAALYRPNGLRMAYGEPLRRALRRGDPVAAVGDDFPLTVPLHKVGRWRQVIGAHAAARLPLDDAPGESGTWPFLLLLLPDQTRRDAAMFQLWQAGLGVSRLYIDALPDYAYLADIVPRQDMPNARDFAARSLSISNSLWVTDDDFETICRALEAIVA